MSLSVKAAQGQLDAYNAHDVESFIKWYTEDVKVYDLDSDELLYEGREIMKERYTNLFNKKGLICKLINRMPLNGTIIDHEEVIRDHGETPFEAIAIYRINKEGFIYSVRFTKGSY